MTDDKDRFGVGNSREENRSENGPRGFSDGYFLSDLSEALLGDDAFGIKGTSDISAVNETRVFRSGDTQTTEGDAGDFPETYGYVDLAAVEAIVMVATEPVHVSLLAEILETTPAVIERACEVLQKAYEAEGRGFELVRIAGGYRYQSSAQYSDYVERFIIRDMPQKLSPAALETLAIIAYKQPISRAQIASIRGVNVDRVVRMLLQKDLIKEVGKDTGPGQAIFFGTTDLFLERLGLDTVADLPPLEDYVPDVATVEALEHVLRDKP